MAAEDQDSTIRGKSRYKVPDQQPTRLLVLSNMVPSRQMTV